MVHELKVFTQTSESPDVHEPHASIRYFYISEQSIILPLLTNSSLNAIISTNTPEYCKNSTNGVKSPSPVTNTTTSSFGDMVMASMAIPTSQSPFFVPLQNVCNSFSRTSNPIFESASKNFCSSLLSARITYATARISFLSATASSNTLPKFTCAL